MSDEELTVTFGFGAEFGEWIKQTFGVSLSPLESLEHDDDWAFVIKMHGFVEAAINHLILTRLNEPKLTQIISKLDTNNRRTGKMAFVQAFDLLPRSCCTFIEDLSTLRNSAVHDIKSLDLSLKCYVQSLDAGQLKRWRRGMTSWIIGEVTDPDRDQAVNYPRHAIFSCCVQVMARAHINERNVGDQQILSPSKVTEELQKFGEYWIYEHKPVAPPQSTPKV